MKTKRFSVVDKRILSFIPYKHVVVSTSLNLNDAMELFSSSISPMFDPILNPLSNSKNYQGEVSKNGFRIRVTNYSRGSSTYVIGKFIPAEAGVKIDMYVYPGPVFLFLLLAVFAGVIILDFLETIALSNYALITGCVIGIMLFGLLNFILIDILDWFIRNLIGRYILENKD